MSSDIAIRVHDLSKHYFLYARPQDRLKQSIVPRLQRLAGRTPAKYYTDFAALDGVSFEVRRGETVGIIGRNGSGKSTLLQIVCGTLQPSGGTVEINGRIAALLELGAGFNPDYTGRENVYLNAAILGLSRAETDRRFDDIAAFADIGQFIDQSVKTYSSGMYVRLAFATAINVDPDILVVDEALAVGDEAFQRKCFARIEQIQERGGTILLVSHAVQTIVQLCSRALLIDGGELLLEGRPKVVTGQYQRLVNVRPDAALEIRMRIKEMEEVRTETIATAAPSDNTVAIPAEAKEWFDPALTSQSAVSYDNAGARISDMQIRELGGRSINMLRSGKTYVLSYRVGFECDARQAAFGFLLKTPTGLVLAGVGTSITQQYQVPSVHPGDTVDVSFRFDCGLLPGTYFVTAGVSAMIAGERRFLHRILDAMPFRVMPEDPGIAGGYFDLNVRPDFVVHSAASGTSIRT